MGFQAEQAERDPECVRMEDGTLMYKRESDGKLETLLERERRLAHNLRMCFNRSFEASYRIACSGLLSINFMFHRFSWSGHVMRWIVWLQNLHYHLRFRPTRSASSSGKSSLQLLGLQFAGATIHMWKFARHLFFSRTSTQNVDLKNESFSQKSISINFEREREIYIWWLSISNFWRLSVTIWPCCILGWPTKIDRSWRSSFRIG